MSHLGSCTGRSFISCFFMFYNSFSNDITCIFSDILTFIYKIFLINLLHKQVYKKMEIEF